VVVVVVVVVVVAVAAAAAVLKGSLRLNPRNYDEKM